MKYRWPNQSRVSLSSTHQFHTKGPLLFSPQNSSVSHQEPLSSSPEIPQFHTKNPSVQHRKSLRQKMCWTEEFWCGTDILCHEKVFCIKRRFFLIILKLEFFRLFLVWFRSLGLSDVGSGCLSWVIESRSIMIINGRQVQLDAFGLFLVPNGLTFLWRNNHTIINAKVRAKPSKSFICHARSL